MDNKTIFVRTRNGEEQVQSRTSHLSDDIKRALLMVDGSATFGEISKRSAPSMRANLADMFEELEKTGLIQVKSFAGKIPKTAMPSKMVFPVKMANPRKNPAADKDSDELDFMSGYAASPRQAPAAEAEEQSKREIEAKKIKAQQEAEAAHRKAEEEARLKLEAAAREQREAEAARIKAEQEARRGQEELEAAKLKVEQEARLRPEAAEKERKEAEAARVKAEQEAARVKSEQEAARIKAEHEAARVKAEQEAKRVRDELEAAKLKAEQEAGLRLEAAERERKATEAARVKAEQEAARIKAEKEAEEVRQAAELKAKMSSEADNPMPGTTITRSVSATVLFFDVVGYTRQSVSKQIEIKRQFNQIVSGCLQSYDGSEHIILDTGDGAAIGFLQHPEDAVDVAIQFRKTVMANSHQDYPDLKVRIGIHFGPINVEKDMNGRSNMVGDGINDAQRVMSFAGIDRIYISRPYYDYISRLKDEYADMFQYRGIQKDKHGREHRVYELIEAASAAGGALSQASKPGEEIEPNPFSFDSFQFDQPQSAGNAHAEKQPATKDSSAEAATAARTQDTFVYDFLNVDEQQPRVELNRVQQSVQRASLPGDTAQATQAADVRQSVKQQVSTPAESNAGKDEVEQKSKERIAEEARAKEMADVQAKVWAEAEQRAQETAKAHAERVARQAEKKPETGRAEKSVRVARVPRKPFAWGKLVGFVVKLGIFLLVLLVGALFIVPYVLPMRGYMPKVQQMLADRLHQPVHLGYISGRILPTPRLDLGEIYIGNAKQFQAATAQINFDIMGVFGDSKPINSVDFQEVKVRGIALTDAAAWLQQLASDKQYPVSHMAITQGTLDADVFQLTDVEGGLNFSPAGKFTRAQLSANSGKYTLGIDATPQNTLLATLTVRGSALPLLPNWTFDELDAKGEIKRDEFLVNEFKAKILGGNLQGNARIAWHSGWHAEGVLNAKKLVMNDLNKLLDGNVDGTAHFKMNSKDLVGLTDSSELEGSFTSTTGLISGLDIVQTARMRSKENLPGGRTHYDGLRGELSYANNVYHFSKVKIEAGGLDADTTFDIAKQQLSGKMKVNLSMPSTMTAELKLGGAVDDPTLVYAP